MSQGTISPPLTAPAAAGAVSPVPLPDINAETYPFDFVQQLLDQLLTVDAQRLRTAVDVQTVAGLILHLGDQRHFAAKVRRPRDPVTLGQHADDLGVRVLRHHPNELLAIALGHPILRLD